MAVCSKCNKPFSPARAKLGKTTCMLCGEHEATVERMSWCITMAYDKGPTQLISDETDLKRTNPKRTT